MAGYIGSTPVPLGIQEQQSFTVTNSSGQTTFNTLGYSDGNTIKVTLNGSLLEGGGVDYTATNGSDIVLTTAASVDDVLTFETLIVSQATNILFFIVNFFKHFFTHLPRYHFFFWYSNFLS